MDTEKQFMFELDGVSAVLHASGKINSITSRNFEIEVNSLFDSGIKFERLIFDFKNVEYISSSGLRVILYAKKKLLSLLGEENESNDDFCSRVIVEGANSEIKEILDVTGFDTIIDVK